jgi:hypothetical protein
VATGPAATIGPRDASARQTPGIAGAKPVVIQMFPTIKTSELEHVTGGGGSSGIKNPLSTKPAITGTASQSLEKALEQIHRPGFDFVAK